MRESFAHQQDDRGRAVVLSPAEGKTKTSQELAGINSAREGPLTPKDLAKELKTKGHCPRVRDS